MSKDKNASDGIKMDVPPERQDLVKGGAEEMEIIGDRRIPSEEENKQLKAQNMRLSTMLWQIIEQMKDNLFTLQSNITDMQNMLRLLSQRIPLTPEMVELINKSKEQQQPQ